MAQTGILHKFSPATSMFNDIHQVSTHHSIFDFDEAIDAHDGRLSCLSSMPQPAVMAVADADSFQMFAWKTRHIRQWSNDDFLEFIYSWVSERSNGNDIVNYPGENFQNLTGEHLYGMAREDFIKLDPLYGDQIFNAIQRRKLQDNSNMPHNQFMGSSFGSNGTHSQSVLSHRNYVSNDINQSPQHRNFPHQQLPYHCQQPQQQLPKPVEDCMNQDTDDDMSPQCNTGMSVYGQQYGTSECGFVTGGIINEPFIPLMTAAVTDQCSTLPANRLQEMHPLVCPNWSVDMDRAEPMFTPQSSQVSCSTPAFIDLSQSGSSGRNFSEPTYINPSQTYPSLSPPVSVTDITPGKQPAVRGNRSATLPVKKSRSPTANENPPTRHPISSNRGGHLWEFIRDLLKRNENPNCSFPSKYGIANGERIIQWEDREKGVFRIVNSKAVAKLWGDQKDNRKTKMTYEKLSRALRWCRSQDFLASVPKNGCFPKKLCFQFGPKATNWQD